MEWPDQGHGFITESTTRPRMWSLDLYPMNLVAAEERFWTPARIDAVRVCQFSLLSPEKLIGRLG